MHSYAFGPFMLACDFELPELQPGSPSKYLLTIRNGAVPAKLRNPAYQDEYCSASPDELLLDIPDIARYLIRKGCEITIEAKDHADPADVRGFLLGNVFAVACHQRQLLPLHASAVLMDGGVVAFLGPSGAGKSTLAAMLAKNGHALVADDICLLDPAALPGKRVLPLPPWLKLWRGSLTALGFTDSGLLQTFSDEDKFKLPVTQFPTAPSKPLPLKALVVLQQPSESDAFRLTQLRPAQIIASMMDLTYQAFILEWLGRQSEHFANCANSLGTTPAYTCQRPWGFDTLPDLASRLEDFFTTKVS